MKPGDRVVFEHYDKSAGRWIRWRGTAITMLGFRVWSVQPDDTESTVTCSSFFIRPLDPLEQLAEVKLDSR